MKKRYLVAIGIILLIVFGFDILGLNTSPVLPTIQLPGETVVRGGIWSTLFGRLGLTNTFCATIVTYVIIIGLAFFAKARSRTADEVPTGYYNVMEMIIEGAYGFVEGAAGKWARNFFPFFMTFVMLILVANWLELVPGVDSIGKWESMGELYGHRAEDDYLIDHPDATEDDLHHVYDDAKKEAMESNIGDLRNGIFLQRAPVDANDEKPEDADWTIVPYLRVSATDLNFTLAMAIISVVMTQFYGFKAQGAGYLSKFWQFDADKIASNPLGVIDIVVGLIELVSEFAKILSFAFRLLGNIFAGQVLLFVIGFLAPVAVVAVYGLEFFVGAIQAVVFGMLTLTFMTQATESHHGDEH
jgi:F-type H+-transporting ATPase subunit a